MITALLLLIIKHYIVDAPLQTPYQFLNKGKYGHPGGLLHASLHMVGTIICFGIVGMDFETSLWLGLADGIIHYHIDYVKMKFGSAEYSKHSHDSQGRPCLCIYDNKFFYWLVADQCAHFATYVLLVFAPLFVLSA